MKLSVLKCVAASLSMAAAISANAVEINVNTGELFMLGEVNGIWGGSQEVGRLERQSDGTFVWEGNLNYTNDDKCFKFATALGNWNEITYLVPEEVNHNGNVRQITPGTHSMMASAEYPTNQEPPQGLKDWFWGITEGQSGKYRIVVNPAEMTFELTRVEEVLSIDRLYMLGLAADSFDSNNPLEMTKSADGVFEWEGEMDYFRSVEYNHNKQFKFCFPTGAWNEVTYLIPVAAVNDGYIEKISEGTYKLRTCTWQNGQQGVDAFFGLYMYKAGVYRISVDTKSLEVTVTLLEDKSQGFDAASTENLYMLGNAAGKWFSDDAFEMAKIGDGVFEWNGEIVWNGENKQFKFCTPKASWDKTVYFTPTSETNSVLAVEPGTYDMKVSANDMEGGISDWFWGIAEGGDNNYKVVVDLNTLKMTLSLWTPTAVESLSAVGFAVRANGSELSIVAGTALNGVEVYTASGLLVRSLYVAATSVDMDMSSWAKGVYVVRTDAGSAKVIK